MRQGLNKRQSRAEIEKTIARRTKSVGNHGTRKDDGFINIFSSQKARRFNHRVSTMCHNNFIRSILTTIIGYNLAVGIRHFEAVNHHQRFHVKVNRATPTRKHFFEVGIFKKQLACYIIILFIKSTACYKYLNHKIVMS